MAEPAELHVAGDLAPDLMNDPKYATNDNMGDDGMADADTCRICRGEGSDSEPLFHPCKCSGSIKFVHQDCLMEWLLHSQKKHCELCKTPFRFTKLYSPNMPQTLPIQVLARHIVIHMAKNLATWLRLCLVITVWLGVLPYAIRQVWRLLFWFSDGGWPSNYQATETTQNSTTIQALELARQIQQASLAITGTTPVTPLQASQTTSASVGGIMEKLVGFLTPISQSLNISAADPLAAGLIKTLYYGLGLSSIVLPENLAANGTVAQYVSGLSSPSRSSSLLSEVSFFRNLTRHAAINELVITIAEGYIITILVVVCFILVFLIREWVVQQQPGINMGAGFNADFAAPDRPREQPAAPLPRLELMELDGLLPAPINRPDRRANIQRPIARPRRRNNNPENEPDVNPFRIQEEPNREAEPLQNGIEPSDAPLSPTAEIQRALAEEPRMTEEFLAIWRRADSDPREVLRIIERENKVDQMRYWVNAMKILQNPLPSDNGAQIPPQHPRNETPQAGLFDTVEGSSASEPHSAPRGSLADSLGVHADSEKGSSSSEGWTDIPNWPNGKRVKFVDEPVSIQDQQGESSESAAKGKMKAKDELERPVSSFWDESLTQAQKSSRNLPSPQVLHSSHGSRPRANSDGPQLRDSISPLANNNWSFSPLRSEGETSSPGDSSMSSKPFFFNDENKNPSMREQKEGFTFNFQETIPSPFSAPLPWETVTDLPLSSENAGCSNNPAASVPEEGADILEMASAPDNPEVEDSLRDVNEEANLRIPRDWEEEFDNNTPFDSDSGLEVENLQVDAEDMEIQHTDLPLLDLPQAAARDPIVARMPEPQGFLEGVAHFLWGGIDDDRQRNEPGPNEEHIVQDIAAEAPFVPVLHHDGFEHDVEFADQDREVVEAAMAAGLDPNDADAIEDAEDFEGIMELVGMRGPIFSLVQNAIFSAFLLALTVAFGVWIPYNIGRVSLLLIANPGPAFKLPLRLIFGCAAFMQDLALSLMGVMSYCLIAMVSWPMNAWSNPSVFAAIPSADGDSTLGEVALNLSHGAVERIMDGASNIFLRVTESEILPFSAASHESLIILKTLISNTFAIVGSTIMHVFAGDYKITWALIFSLPLEIFNKTSFFFFTQVPIFLAKPDSWVISLEVGKRVTPLDLELCVWSGWDRFFAVFAGYTALSLLGALYVKKGSPFSTGQVGRDWEATFIDFLNQAGGVMKVILIISIEMLVFPLYCGLLLDAALLPLFEDTTIVSRILFTLKSPATSIFVHWFVGTCYMFHFALFVSMCRKIMRKGVLYFIRDPDDPTFHPVRDVLERNVATQLRKILFSALVYGGLVVVCLGGVVWGLAFTFRGVLPIHWSSNEPVLEFPIDLLFYNFLMPLAVNFFKPSDGLHAMYSWWFRQCARMLRLTWFMFDERKQDEEGYHVRRTWKDVLLRAAGDPLKPITTDDIDEPFHQTAELNAYFRRDGRYVRAPASDQVRIPKGTTIFLDVDEMNNRTDGKRDGLDGVHGKNSSLYKQVYIPPWFRLRISLFIISIWFFAALTGVCTTIVPLVFGRHVFGKVIPSHVRKNDVYAFSIGVYILGSALYAIVHLGKFLAHLRTTLAINAETPQHVLRRVKSAVSRIARIAWTWSAFIFVLPTLFAFLIEFYLIVPMHTYLALEERHTVHFVQTWTLGLLYVKLLTRIILWYEDSRPAQSLRAITRGGYLNPDARLATRSFILPLGLFLTTALVAPWISAWVLTNTLLKSHGETHMLVYRYAYPMTLALGCDAVAMWMLLRWLKGWRMKIRDEVYLIGERLHNFGDRKVTSGVAGSVGGVAPMRRLET